MQVLEIFLVQMRKPRLREVEFGPRATQQIRAELGLKPGFQCKAMEVLKGTQEPLW